MNEDEFRKNYARLQERITASDDLKQKTKSMLKSCDYYEGGEPPRRRASVIAPLWTAGIAACLVIVVGVGLMATTGMFGRIGSALSGNSFQLLAYADEGKSPLPGQAVAVGIEDFYPMRTSAGYYYDGETREADENIAVASRNYNLDLTCTGSNIETITYIIEGPDASFGSWAVPNADDLSSEAGRSTEFTVDYDEQNADDLVRELALDYVIDPEYKAEFDHWFNLKSESGEEARHIEAILARCDMRRLAQTTITITATFVDGTTQTKVYRIQPVDDFEQSYLAYEDAKRASDDTLQEGLPFLIELVEQV